MTTQIQLTDMKIAIVGPSFFGYLETLQAGFRARGIEAQFYDERWSNTVLSKIAFRFLPRAFTRRSSDAHHRKLVDAIMAQGATHVLVISSELFPVAFLEDIKSKGIKLIAYSFDSFANKPHMRLITEICDAGASFDPDDCNAFGLEYVPLYSNLVAKDAPTPIADRSVDFLYFGTLHSNRPYWIARVKTACDQNNWQGKFFLFFHNKLLWYIRFALSPSVWKLGKTLSTKSFPSAVLNAAALDAKVVVDVHHPSQTGLTMRVFEALSTGSVVISTNPNIRTYLPDDIAAQRVRHFDAATLPAVMAESLTMTPGALTADEVYYLSADRYIDQLCRLIADGPKIDPKAETT